MIVFLAAGYGMVVVALQIGYLPTLYTAFNRRETEVALLDSRAGVPSLGTGTARAHVLRPRLRRVDSRYAPRAVPQWERWSADVAESHTPTCRWSGSARRSRTRRG